MLATIASHFYDTISSFASVIKGILSIIPPLLPYNN